MGQKADEALDIPCDDLAEYLHNKHSVYMDYEGKDYYLTDVNESYWRAQDTTSLNEKGHYTDCSELVPTLGEFLKLPFLDGKSVEDVASAATFHASVKQ